MPKPGEVVTVDFAGATGLKRRPAVVVSSDQYHRERPDVIVAVLTTNVAAATAASDYLLQDWQLAGLHSASAFRSYFGMAPKSAVRHVGHLSQRDWDGVLKCLGVAIADS